jgi:hypothetical protein
MLILSDSVFAQDDNNFKGVSAVSIVVENLREPQANRCNVTQSGLDAAVRVLVDQSRLRLDERSHSNIYVNVNISPVTAFCLANVAVSLNRTLSIPGTSQLVYGAQVWDGETLISGEASGFGQRVYQFVSTHTRELLSQWIKANPR